MNGNMARGLILSAWAALTLGGTLAGAAGAQYAPQYGSPPQGQWGAGPQVEYYQEQGRPDFGARRGYSIGFDMGVSDRRTGHSFRPTHLDEFKHVPDSPPWVPRGEFKHAYRDAFLRGYQRGYGQ